MGSTDKKKEGQNGNGYILLDRKIRDHWIWSDPEYLRAWIDLLMMANYEDSTVLFDDKPIKVPRGGRITSIRKLSERWGWTRRRTTRFLKMLESESMISLKISKNSTTYKVSKYNEYQTYLRGRRTTDSTTDSTTHDTQRKNNKNISNAGVMQGDAALKDFIPSDATKILPNGYKILENGMLRNPNGGLEDPREIDWKGLRE